MKIILITLGSRGDINPFICLGTVLTKRGHDVTLISSEIYEDIVTSAGLNFISCSPAIEYSSVINNPEFYDARKSSNLVVDYLSLKPMRKLYDIISKFDHSNLMIITTPFMLGAKIASEKFDIPLISICLQPMSFWSVVDTPVYPGSFAHKLPYFFRKLLLSIVDKYVMDRLLSSEINTFRAELGLNKVSNIYSKWMFSSQMNIGLFPEWFAKPASDWPTPVKLTGFLHYDENANQSLDEKLVHFLQVEGKPLVLTYGTATTQCKKFFTTFVEAARLLNKRVLLLTRYTEHLPKLNADREMHVPYVSLQKILPYAEAIIHHGGIGTLSQSLVASIPQLIVPLAHDQFDNAARVEKIGVGLRLDSKDYTVNDAMKKIQELTDSNQIKTNCILYSKKINFDQSEKQTCQIIESISL